MRFGMRSGLLAAAALALVSGGPADATDFLIPGKIGIVKDARLFKVVAKPLSGTFTIPAIGGGGDPLLASGQVDVFDTDASGSLTDPLTGGAWTGLGTPPGIRGYKYKNTAAPTGGRVKIIILKPTVIKILAKDDDTIQPGTMGGNLGIILSTGTTPDRYCASFGGTLVKNDPTLFKKKDAPAPGACPVAGPSCCNGHGFFNFSNVTAAGDCGDILDATGMLVTNIDCSGLYIGGAGNSVPLPFGIPDLASPVASIASCAADVATLGGTTSTQTGSIKTCTDPGCFFAAPLTVPNPVSTPVSSCVIIEIATAPSGSVDCGTGAASISVPLSAGIFLAGDKDAGATGVQPCPRCLASTCVGGPNNGMACVAGTTAIDLSYPTSHDCPPDASDSIGTLPIAFALSSGVVTWTGTVATNDTGSTASSQTRVFSGFCRDVALPGGTSSFDADATPGTQFKECWKNGMAVGTPCSEADNGAESCEQRNAGAFGPNGGGNRTIRAIGNGMSILGGPAAETLVGAFSIPPTFEATIDAGGDLPGPGAVAIPGTAQTCSVANPCP